MLHVSQELLALIDSDGQMLQSKGYPAAGCMLHSSDCSLMVLELLLVVATALTPNSLNQPFVMPDLLFLPLINRAP